MKKLVSILSAAALLLSMAACSGDNTSDSGASSQTTSSANSESAQNESGAPSDSSLPDSGSGDNSGNSLPVLSNEIPLTEDGDIDMDVALSYETDIEALKAEFDAKTVDPSKPVSENSNADTLEVFNYLCSVYGKNVITAQQMMDSGALEDLVYYNATKDIPAMKGFDFIFCTGNYISDDMINDAIKWHKESGGLVTFTWHWNVPSDIDNPEGKYAFYTEEITNWSQINAVTPGTKEYERVIHDIDWIATKLQRLESEGITVLFRPLHEASGSWFWWGVQDKSSVENEVFQKLWYMIYDRMENLHKLTNIIWVWNGQSAHCKVSPNSYDIAGIDHYVSDDDLDNHTALTSQYNTLKSYTDDSGKMLALSECGNIPDPADCAATDTMWLYYMTWNGGFIYEEVSEGTARVSLDGTPYPNTKRLTNEMLQEYFSNEVFITHSDLPEFRTGTKAIPEKITTWEYFKMG